ncbi:MAG TPA: rod shape-determining protein MreC [Anaerolineaceae bacterium]|nr:rod shape-determining protein MreC [Anaerolineaceae bacterium]
MKSPVPRFWQTVVVVLIVVGLMLLAVSGYLGPVLRAAQTPLVATQRWISSRYLAIYELITSPTDMAALRQQNQDLQNQVSQLQTEVIELEQRLGEAQVLYALLDFAREQPQNTYVAAAVIGRDPNPFMRYIFIDRGSDSGVLAGMPVVTAQGLIGRVDAVTAQACRVALITDPATVINVTLQSLKADAQLVGSLTGELTLEMIPSDVNLQPGELVLTSGLGGDYPSDVLIGQVVSVRKLETDLFQTATVQSAVDFNNLQAVLVITNFRPVDIAPLIPED